MNIHYIDNEIEFINREFNKDITIGKKSKRVRLTEKQYEILKRYRLDIGLNNKSKREFSSKEIERLVDLQDLLKLKGNIQLYDITEQEVIDEDCTIVLQHSDQHIDEVVVLESTLGKNKYNLEEARKRNDLFFTKSVRAIKERDSISKVGHVILAELGDSIGNWIHPELEQTNSISPNAAIREFTNMLVTGIKYMRDNLDMKITVIGVCGNHARETKRIQYNNFTEVNKEYWMYLNVKDIVESVLKLDNIEFIIPESPLALVKIYGKNYLMSHGNQFNYVGGVGGIMIPAMRWFKNMNESMSIEAAFIGHWHTSIFTKVIINGSPKGWDSFAAIKGIPYEPATQNMISISKEDGITDFKRIYLQ